MYLVSQRGDFNTAYGGGYHFFGQPSALPASEANYVNALLHHARTISSPPFRMHRLLEVLAKHHFQLSGAAANRRHLIRIMCLRICGTRISNAAVLHASHHCGYAGKQIISQ